jgi:pimeloyl-ACP methyl ester carboxylesterase
MLPYRQEVIDDLRSRLRRVRWPDAGGPPGWECGTEPGFLRDLCEYWAADFDWLATIERLRRDMQHYMFTADGYAIHFIHRRGRGPDPIPLILTHGWPGSFLEMEAVIPLLADPGAHGGIPADSFDVIVPSLPGFGYSSVPPHPGTNAQEIARLWVKLMGEIGYERFAAQGGDIGASVTTALGLRFQERLIGIHLNYLPGSYSPYLASGPAISQAELEFLGNLGAWEEEQGAYAHIQRTRPVTASYGLADSPVGLAAWIIEKFRDWSDCGGDVYQRFTRDALLANLSLYWTTNTIGSSFRMYYEGSRKPLRFGAGDFVQVPTAFAAFPGEISCPPRSWIERGYDLRRWSEMPSGGHFAAAEDPDAFAEDIRAFFRTFRNLRTKGVPREDH